MARKFGPPIQIVEKSSSNFQNESLIVYNYRKKSLDNCGRLEIQLLSMTSPAGGGREVVKIGKFW